MSVRSILLCLFGLLVMQAGGGVAHADIVRMRSQVCYATTPASTHVDIASVSQLSYDCARTPPASAYRPGWVWLRLRDPSMVRDMPAQWRLLVDQVRFEEMAVMAVGRDGRVQTFRVTPGSIGDHWALGGMMRFNIDRPGAEIRAVHVGFRHLDDLSLMRKISAASPAEGIWLAGAWLALMGVFAGAIFSAFAYNLLIYTGHRQAFQRWYLIWTVAALTYGLAWTNVIACVVPGFVGPIVVRTDYVLVSAMIALGNMFFITVIEDGLLPRWLKRCAVSAACAGFLLGCACAVDWIFPPALLDLWLNCAFLASALSMAVGIGIAIRKRSRVVWFYLVGWTPVFAVFGLRVARNFALIRQDDLVDMSTFAALAFESAALSLAIADRFRLLRQERDTAEQARQAIAIESDTLRRAAHTDFLTGLGNRAAFQAALRRMSDAADVEAFTLLLIDVDHLKDINDRLGHDGGDVLLGHVAAGLVKAAGPRAQVSRIGGDEFAILLPGSEDDRLDICDALENLQGETLNHGGRSWAISLSVGFACFPQDADTPALLVKNADLALYQAKQLGRRRLHAYDASLRARLNSRQAFSHDAYQGLEKGQFSLHYQPIVALQSGIPHSHEALLRWNHPDHGLMTPAIFGDMLADRKIGLMVQQRVLDMALEALRDHPERLARLSSNFTAAQLDGPYAATRLLARMRDFGVAPGRLCIEVTEDVVLDRTINDTAKALEVLHDAGVRVALDDFGTGYASLIHLKHLPIDILKIDRSFILSLFEDDGQSEEIIRAIIGLGHGLRKQVVAEGVETEQQRVRLLELGCTFGQGFLFARPQAMDLLPPLGIVPSAAA